MSEFAQKLKNPYHSGKYLKVERRLEGLSLASAVMNRKAAVLQNIKKYVI